MGSNTLWNAKYRLYTILQAIYPEYDWLPWRFPSVPKQYWENKSNHKKLAEWLARELNIKEMDDWYKVTTKVLQ